MNLRAVEFVLHTHSSTHSYHTLYYFKAMRWNIPLLHWLFSGEFSGTHLIVSYIFQEVGVCLTWEALNDDSSPSHLWAPLSSPLPLWSSRSFWPSWTFFPWWSQRITSQPASQPRSWGGDDWSHWCHNEASPPENEGTSPQPDSNAVALVALVSSVIHVTIRNVIEMWNSMQMHIGSFLLCMHDLKGFLKLHSWVMASQVLAHLHY